MLTTRVLKGSTLLGALLLLLAGTSAFTQEKAKDAFHENGNDEGRSLPKNLSLVRAGYTRPGNPSDRVGRNGEIIQAALDSEQAGPVIGATVYFAVYRGTGGIEGFDVDLPGLTDMFVPGRSFENSISPNFDRKAKYLYLYQIVNDRGLNPPKGGVAPAATSDVHTSNISDFALRLVVDPRYITSWGHFQNTGFEAKVGDRKVGKNGIIGAADDLQIQAIAFSSNPAIVKELPNKRFQDRSPAYGLGSLLNYFGLDKSNLNLQNSAAYANLKKSGIKQANWAANEMEVSAKGGREPDYVQVMFNNLKDDSQPTLGGMHIGDTIFRVDFKKTNTVNVGQHSVVFGFTSDLPPTDEPIRVEGQMPHIAGAQGKNAQGTAAIHEVALLQAPASGSGQAPASALGTAPTPIGSVAAAPPAQLASALIGGGIAGGAGGPGLGVGLPFPGAFFGHAFPAAAVGGGTGNGNGQGQTTQAQQQAQQQAPNNNTINFNATLTNQQSQAQQQFQQQQQQQQQQQKQNQNQNHHHNHGHVVPEPSAIILGLLGLPALFWFRRRGLARMSAAS